MYANDPYLTCYLTFNEWQPSPPSCGEQESSDWGSGAWRELAPALAQMTGMNSLHLVRIGTLVVVGLG